MDESTRIITSYFLIFEMEDEGKEHWAKEEEGKEDWAKEEEEEDKEDWVKE